MISTPEKSADEWIAMIRQAADQGLLKCTFTGGDPFMREDFEEIYCKAYDMGLRISIFTNGILIGKKHSIADHGSVKSVSLEIV
jgi:pyrroloquinoline quinone biosynthesis protein E